MLRLNYAYPSRRSQTDYVTHAHTHARVWLSLCSRPVCMTWPCHATPPQHEEAIDQDRVEAEGSGAMRKGYILSIYIGEGSKYTHTYEEKVLYHTHISCCMKWSMGCGALGKLKKRLPSSRHTYTHTPYTGRQTVEKSPRNPKDHEKKPHWLRT